MLHRTDRNGVALIRLEHGKAQALDLELAAAITECLEQLDRDETVRALVITGTGSIFSAGVDLYRLLAEGPSYVRAFVPALVGAFQRLFGFSRPVIAAINGHAIAGGCVLAAACDYRVMARGDGSIGVPELRVGVPFPLVAIEILRFATSAAHLQELLYRGKTYGVDEAYGRGLVDEVVTPESLLERASEVAELLASEPAARFRITKRQLRGPTLDAIRRHAPETEADVIAEWERPATLEAIRRYLDDVRRRRG
jgi:enoyl-CoA hydratase